MKERLWNFDAIQTSIFDLYMFFFFLNMSKIAWIQADVSYPCLAPNNSFSPLLYKDLPPSWKVLNIPGTILQQTMLSSLIETVPPKNPQFFIYSFFLSSYPIKTSQLKAPTLINNIFFYFLYIYRYIEFHLILFFSIGMMKPRFAGPVWNIFVYKLTNLIITVLDLDKNLICCPVWSRQENNGFVISTINWINALIIILTARSPCTDLRYNSVKY